MHILSKEGATLPLLFIYFGESGGKARHVYMMFLLLFSEGLVDLIILFYFPFN
jgi:hypothetical protein